MFWHKQKACSSLSLSWQLKLYWVANLKREWARHENSMSKNGLNNMNSLHFHTVSACCAVRLRQTLSFQPRVQINTNSLPEVEVGTIKGPTSQKASRLSLMTCSHFDQKYINWNLLFSRCQHLFCDLLCWVYLARDKWCLASLCVFFILKRAREQKIT